MRECVGESSPYPIDPHRADGRRYGAFVAEPRAETYTAVPLGDEHATGGLNACSGASVAVRHAVSETR